jgi:iron complex outermembrane receptor protein
VKNILVFCSASALALSAAPAFAQNSDQSGGDIVVTANRQESLLSKTPGSISAFNNEKLQSSGVTDARQLNNIVPNLRLTDAVQGTGNGVSISIRGVSSQTGNPSAAFLMDGIYVADTDVITGAFYDLERVEVLRGPQGTLYGRNTTAGLVNVISAAPKDKFEAAVDATYGNFNAAILNGMVNVPVGGGLAVRAAVNYDRRDSYVKQPDNQNPQREFLSGRLSFGGTVGDLTFVVRGDYSDQDGTLANIVPTTNFFPDLATTPVGTNPTYVETSSSAQRTLGYSTVYPSDFHNYNWGVMVDATYDFGPVQLTYLGSHREFHNDMSQNYRQELATGADRLAYINGKSNQESHELRLAFGTGTKIHGQIGGNYFTSVNRTLNQFGQPESASGIFTIFPQPSKATSYAGFGQVTYDILPDLHLTGGLRYTKDKSDSLGSLGLAYPDGSTILFSETFGHAESSKLTWKAGVDYDLPSLGLIYASVSTGYKAGGSNGQCLVYTAGCLPAEVASYAPETLTSYEAGVKFAFLDRLIRLNLTGYHYDYKGLQVAQVFRYDDVGQNVIQNAASAKVDGIESELNLSPTPDDVFTLTFNYTDARYDSFLATSPSLETAVFDGNPLSQAAKYTASIGYNRTFEVGDGGKIVASVVSRYSSSYYIQDFNQLALFRQPKYTKTDVTLTYKAPSDKWYVEAFGRNLENSITLGSASADSTYAYARFEAPRTYGVRAGMKF